MVGLEVGNVDGVLVGKMDGRSDGVWVGLFVGRTGVKVGVGAVGRGGRKGNNAVGDDKGE